VADALGNVYAFSVFDDDDGFLFPNNPDTAGSILDPSIGGYTVIDSKTDRVTSLGMLNMSGNTSAGLVGDSLYFMVCQYVNIFNTRTQTPGKSAVHFR
jgi:hypothetical protein